MGSGEAIELHPTCKYTQKEREYRGIFYSQNV